MNLKEQGCPFSLRYRSRVKQGQTLGRPGHSRVRSCPVRSVILNNITLVSPTTISFLNVYFTELLLGFCEIKKSYGGGLEA